jgi:ABC-type uncharacterized transport system ATPase subunit
LAGNLSHGQKQWQTGMLLMQDPKLLLLDEPVAGMTTRKQPAPPSCFDQRQDSLLMVVDNTRALSAPSEIVTVLCDGPVLCRQCWTRCRQMNGDRGLSWRYKLSDCGGFAASPTGATVVAR